MLKKYKVENPANFWECSVEIDEEFTFQIKSGESMTTREAIKNMVEFWSDSERNLDYNDGDYTRTFLQMLARKILYIICEYNYNLHGVTEQFLEEEGWFPMDGTCGIKISDIDADFEFEYSDFEVEEVIK